MDEVSSIAIVTVAVQTGPPLNDTDTRDGILDIVACRRFKKRNPIFS